MPDSARSQNPGGAPLQAAYPDGGDRTQAGRSFRAGLRPDRFRWALSSLA